MTLDLNHRVAVITGGANGIGLACATRFGQLGARLLIADRDTEALQGAAGQLRANGHDTTTIRCDVASDDDMIRLADTARELGDVGILMLNAGVSAGGRLELVPAREWLRLYDINVAGVVRGLNAFIPQLTESNSPAFVVITGSSASFDVDPRGVDAPYAATKHALLAVTRAYANYLAPHHIDVRLLAPGLTDTAFPRSSTIWTRRGTQISTERPVDQADTAADVAQALIDSYTHDTRVVALDQHPLESMALVIADAWRR
jgi:NAD(P)-dependent dehydrogenase (short-subunit alcohol dehydrogenase family)